MGKRLSRIVTRTGDDGCTGLADGTRLPKSSPRMVAIGTVDELNSQLGLFLAELGDGEPAELHAFFRGIQNDLFDLGGELAMPGHRVLDADRWRGLEQRIDALNADLEPLENFILPGGSRLVAQCHVVRAVSRRAERCYVALCEEIPAEDPDQHANEASRIYLNRLSDLFFVTARWLARQRGEPEILWQQRPR